jgi:N-acyl homoserine lactone hydrolase
MADWSMWMLEYAHCLEQPVGCILYAHWNAGTRLFPYSYLYLEGQGHHVLVDVGYDEGTYGGELGDRYGVSDWQDADVVLAKVGVRPEEIDTIILTHAHYDHIGNLSKFPQAHVYIQRREIERCHWALDKGSKFASLTGALDPADLMYLAELAETGRLTLVDGDMDDVLPGLHLRPAFDTHSDGSQYVVVSTPKENWVLAGDNLYSYENAEGVNQSGEYIAIGFGGGSAWNNLLSIDEMLSVAGSTARIVVVHENETFNRHPSWRTEDNLAVAELHLAENVLSRRPITQMEQ